MPLVELPSSGQVTPTELVTEAAVCQVAAIPGSFLHKSIVYGQSKHAHYMVSLWASAHGAPC